MWPLKSALPEVSNGMWQEGSVQTALWAKSGKWIAYITLGTDGGLDFGTQKVSGESKSLTMQLRNRGKYEIGYK